MSIKDPQPYLPSNDPKFLKWLHKAGVRAARMDAADRKAGFATPTQSGMSATLRTAMSAIDCAYATQDWDVVADALVLIIHAERYARQLESQLDIVVTRDPG